MKTTPIQKEFRYRQINEAPVDEIFPLLCPVREKDWIDGWEYRLIFSRSGLIEQGCVFATPHHGASETIWYVTIHDPQHYSIEFVRHTPGETIVKISIQLNPLPGNQTEADITYLYTALSDEQADFIQNKLQENFNQSMRYWEQAINHYIKTGQKLMKN